MSEARTWYFTVERDIPIEATDEGEAFMKFRQKYGDKPILGVILPLTSSMRNKE